MFDRAELDRLMALAADGERTAIDPLFAALWPLAVRYATRLVGDLGEDCAQEALVRMFGQLPRYDRERDALTWALTHVTWQARTARRTQQRRNEVPATEAPVAHAGLVDGASLVEDRELVRAAVATLAELPPRDAEIIVATLVDDDALRQALAPATFRKRLERALARLRDSWRSRHGTL